MRISRALAGIVPLGVLATPVFGVVFSPPRQVDPAPATDDRYDFGGRVAADRMGTWAGVWQSMPANGTAWGPFTDILVSRSVDDGVHWAAPTTIQLGSTQHPIAAPDIATDGAGTWVAVWWTRVGDSGDFDLFFSRSVDNASTWSAPATLNTNAATDTGDDFDPRIATDRAGNWIVTWVSTDSLGGTIGNDNDILASRSTNGGLTWSAPTPVAPSSADGAFDFDPVIATDEAGMWKIVWMTANRWGSDYDLAIVSSTNAGASWTPVAPLTPGTMADATSEVYPDLAADGSGHWVAVWGALNGDHDVWVSRSSDGGTSWSTPAYLNDNAPTDTGQDGRPNVDTDGAGTWIAAWHVESPGGIYGNDVDVFYATSTDDGATWTSAAPLHASAAGDTAGDQDPQVVSDHDQGWIITWSSDGSAGGAFGLDYNIVYVLAAGACGDGDVGLLEECDDSNTNDGDGCDSNCTFTACGNGIVTAGEDCDDSRGCCAVDCTFRASGAACNDGDPCTAPDTCDGAGLCVGGPPASDLDDDGLGDECDPNDAGLAVEKAELRSPPPGKKPRGRIKTKGVVATSGGPLSASTGFALQVTDAIGLDRRFVWEASECVASSKGSIRCRAGEGHYRFGVRPVKGTPGAYRVRVALSGLGGLPPHFEPTLSIDVAQGDIRTGIDHVGSIATCVSSSGRLSCAAP
jgi:cysteine-rich repeat protein